MDAKLGVSSLQYMNETRRDKAASLFLTVKVPVQLLRPGGGGGGGSGGGWNSTKVVQQQETSQRPRTLYCMVHQ